MGHKGRQSVAKLISLACKNEGVGRTFAVIGPTLRGCDRDVIGAATAPRAHELMCEWARARAAAQGSCVAFPGQARRNSAFCLFVCLFVCLFLFFVFFIPPLCGRPAPGAERA